ncbi:MAG: hypothetical protein ACXWOV_07910, partial [Isosphaeraceae bacterium]
MSNKILEELSQAMSKIDRPGTFCVSGSVQTVLPGLEVDGLGPIGLPLTGNQAKDLIRMRYMLSWESFLEDPFAYAPLPARTVLSGVLPPGASDATLFGA